MTNSQNAKFTIVSKNGRTNMSFASSLTDHLANRGGDCRFLLGEWLKSLTNAALASLIALADRSIEGDHSGAPELLAIYVLGVAAERGGATSQYSIKTGNAADISERIGVLAVIEDLRRQEMLDVPQTTSIDSFDQNRIVVTDKGLREADVINRFGQRTGAEVN